MFKKLKEIIKTEKERMYSYQFKFNYYFLAPFAFVFIIGPIIALSISIPLGFAYGNSIVTYLPIIIWGSLVILMCIILIPLGFYVNKRVISDETDKFKMLYVLDNTEESIQKLIEDNWINDKGFVAEDNSILEFDDIKLELESYIFYGGLNLFLRITHFDNIYLFPFNPDMYRLFKHRGMVVENQEFFELFEENKEQFITLASKNNKLNKLKR